MRKFIFQVIFLIILSAAGFANAGTPSAPVAQSNQTQLSSPSTGKSHWIIHAKDIAQMLFWISLGTVSILTYLRAKKTILQPIRTEIFKVQLEEMRTILSIFVGKGEIELRGDFGFDKVLRANAVMMYDAFAFTFFDVKTDRNKRPYCDSECPASLVTEEGMLKHFELVDDHLRTDASDSTEKKKDPRVRAALWNDYTHYELRIPREFSEQERRIQDLLENPLLPSECSKLLTEYCKTVRKNLELTRELLTECAKEMPDKYSSLEDLKNSSFDWLNQRFVDKFVHLKPKADAIIAFVRSCYDVDNLLS